MMHFFSFSGFRAFKAAIKTSHYLMHLQILAPKQTLEYRISVLKQYEQSLTQLLVQSYPGEKFPDARQAEGKCKVVQWEKDLLMPYTSLYPTLLNAGGSEGERAQC